MGSSGNELQIIYDVSCPVITERIPNADARLGSLRVIKVKLEDTGIKEVDFDGSEISVTPTSCTKGRDGDYLTCTFAQDLNTQTEEVQEYTVSVIPNFKTIPMRNILFRTGI